jgi:hypothetical protein
MAAGSLPEIAAELDSIDKRAARLVAAAGVHLLERPAPQSWSAAECLEHLNISTRAFLAEWTRVLPEARRQGLSDTGKPFKTDFSAKVLLWLLEPPASFRFPTAAPFVPVAIERPQRVLPDFLACQLEIRAVLRDAEGLALDRIRMTSPFSARVHYSVWSSFRLTGAHERRHLWQAERALAVVTGKPGN